MTPTLSGRWQSRLHLMWIVGFLLTIFWSALLWFFQILPTNLADPNAWKLFILLGYATIIGLILDLLYIYIQSFHWDHDWPIIYQFTTGFVEGVILFGLFFLGWLPGIAYGDNDWWVFLLHYGSVWIATFLWLFGPIRVLFPRWRFRGGEFF